VARLFLVKPSLVVTVLERGGRTPQLHGREVRLCGDDEVNGCCTANLASGAP
jgi:hypothetical protein